jgi:amino acid adenylation domain-containing protein
VTVPEFLTTLRCLRVRIWADGDRLRCDAPKGVMTPHLQEQLANNRAEIIRALREVSGGRDLRHFPLGRPRRGEPELSFFQERLWIQNRLDPGNPAYNMVAWVRDTGPINPVAMQNSLTEVVRRHEILRSAFRDVAGRPVLVIAPPEPVTLTIVDLRHLPPPEQEAEIARLVAWEAREPFRLELGALVRPSCAVVGDYGYVLLVAMHHIITDAWSMGIFFREWQAVYRAYSAGAPSPLPELPLQYPDYAHWQRRWLRDSELDRQLAFWMSQLSGAPHVVALPTDRPRPAFQTSEGAGCLFEIPPDLAERLREVCRQEDITLFMALLAAFNVLLRRHTGQTDLLVGTPIATRTKTELEGLVGPFINTLILRTRMTEDDTGRSLRARIRQTVLQAHAHQDVPFAQLVEVIDPERSMAYAPLVQVAFTLQNAPLRSEFAVTTGGAMYDLTLHTWEAGTTIGGCFEYATALFDATTIERMSQHLQVLLRGMVFEPDRPVAEQPMLTAAERRELVEVWNATQHDYPNDVVFSQLFERQARRTPSRVAVACEEFSWSYHELNARANRLAHRLRRAGVGPGVMVAVCLDRSPRLLEALLGVMKAGGAYLPLDPDHPPRRLSFMVRESGAGLVVSEMSVRQRVELRDVSVLCLDGEPSGLEEESSDDPPPIARPTDPAYVIYTSGSTGQPKGVEVPHGALVNLLWSMKREPGLSEHDTFLSVTTLAFDIAGLELFLPLLVGGKVVVVSSAVVQDGRRLQESLARWGATAMQATPATWQMLVDTGWTAAGGRAELSAWCGGDVLSRGLADALLLRARAVWNLYGPTETTIWSTVARVEPGTEPVAIGRPIANTQLYVLNSDRQPAPVGVPGELYIGGQGLANGYVNRPDLTRERFEPNPFDPDRGSRVYRTGDLVRYRPDGQLEHLGRLDQQVKLRGFRIELGEIEALLTAHPAVRTAVVALQNSRLVAFVVTHPGAMLTATDARTFLREQLPDYMVPALVVTLDELPLTPNGKIDRKALPDPFAAALESEELASPETATERLIAEVWQELLGVPQVGVHQNFFDLGGHSLLAVRAAYEIERRTGRPLDVRPIFFETLRQLAVRCESVDISSPASVRL